MDRKEKIEELLNRFISGEIEEEEKQLIFNLFNQQENKDLIQSWIREHWEQLNTDNLDIKVDSELILSKIHQQIEKYSLHRNSEKRSGLSAKRIISIGLRYAAIFLIAFAAEWFLMSYLPKIKATSHVSYNEIAVPHGSKSFIVLADSTKVWLNAGAKLKYPTSFGTKERDVFLEGEAFFEVQKDKKRPFFVKMNGMDIKVHGTKFNVKAYAEDSRIETSLIEGSIEVIGLKSGKDQNLYLKPGQKLVLYKDLKYSKVTQLKEDTTSVIADTKISTQPIKIKSAELVKMASSEPEIAWKKDKLVFEKQRFDEVKTRLERWYGVTIDVKDTSILNYRFTGTFDKETFEQAMQALQQAARFEYVLKKKHVTIKKEI